MLYLGVDPGLDGAMAVVDEQGGLVAVYDTPTLAVKGKMRTKRLLNTPSMAQSLRALVNWYEVGLSAALEDVHSMPREGVSSAFTFGRGLGVWEGILATLNIPVHMVSPQKWKKVMLDGMGKEKDASRVRALQLYPKAELHLKKHHGRADAILIALWLCRQRMGATCSNP